MDQTGETLSHAACMQCSWIMKPFSWKIGPVCKEGSRSFSLRIIG